MKGFIPKLSVSIIVLCLLGTVEAGIPVWTFTPLTPTTLSVPSNSSATVQYQVTNQSARTHTLKMQPIRGVNQLTTGLGICGNPFILPGKASCTLSLQVTGSLLTTPVEGGPIVCQQGFMQQCYRPSPDNILHITAADAITDATISVADSPLMLITDGPSGSLTVTNNSLIVSATNIASNFTGTALDGNVTETGNDCASVPPQASCTLEYTPGNMIVPLTNFPIQGTNTNAVTAAIQIDYVLAINSINPSSGPASGGTGVTLTGTGFTGTTDITFGGTSATNINVVNSTTVTAVTPAHASGAVNVVITTPGGSATSTNGYTYLTTVVGQSAFGGKIACLNGGLNNLIAAPADSFILWGSVSTTNATSNTDGAANTVQIVSSLGTGGSPYAAEICNNYEIDSQGNTPCEAGNACYSDWFLPAGNNVTASGQLNCLYTNQADIGGFQSQFYWSSTESGSDTAWMQSFANGTEVSFFFKFIPRLIRCVRAFSP